MTKSIEIVQKKMPQKCLYLTNLLNEDVMKYSSNYIRDHVALPDYDMMVTLMPVSKKRKLNESESSIINSNGSEVNKKTKVSSNIVIMETMKIVKKEVIEFIDLLNIVKIWIQLNIPRIEDGNNFGVGVQEETLSELSRGEESCFTALDMMAKYYVTRAGLVSKCLKYPGIEDFRHSVMELDEKMYFDLRIACRDLRNNCAILYDMIRKNWEKITKPRSRSSSVMTY